MTITLVANSPMVSGMAAMLAGISGDRRRQADPHPAHRVHPDEQDLQGVVDGKVMISVGGNASVEDKTAYLEAMDFKALAEF